MVFYDASEDLIMADDVATPSNPPIASVEEEELEEVGINMNVSQRSCEEEPSRKVVCIRVNRLAWDHPLSPNPHAFANLLRISSCSWNHAKKV